MKEEKSDKFHAVMIMVFGVFVMCILIRMANFDIVYKLERIEKKLIRICSQPRRG